MRLSPLVISVIAVVLYNSCNVSRERNTETTSEKSIIERVQDRTFPSAFMAWYNIDMPEFPLNTEEQRIQTAAMHDLMWEEPLSQLGEGVDLVLGLIWKGEHHGLSSSFDEESLQRARQNRKRLMEYNPNMITLLEVRWRDAPMSFLPEDSEWWLRDAQGEIVKGWLGGWEPFYKLDYSNPDFQDNVARQSKIAVESGVYDGIMLDWSGHLDIIRKVRAAIGPDKLIIVNIHDNIEDGKKYKDLINGSFMELNPIDTHSIPVEELVIMGREDHNKGNWDQVQEALLWFEDNLLPPQVNCLEVWGHRKDFRRMRATTTLGLTHSDGYVLYADPNPLVTPDHLHDWYPFWDVELGKPLAKKIEKEDGSIWREFEGGIVVYNHYQNGKVLLEFEENKKRVSTGEIARSFSLQERDGDMFIKVN
jgi:hypothetical protein